jgi:hypothetical protein
VKHEWVHHLGAVVDKHDWFDEGYNPGTQWSPTGVTRGEAEKHMANHGRAHRRGQAAREVDLGRCRSGPLPTRGSAPPDLGPLPTRGVGTPDLGPLPDEGGRHPRSR